MLNFAQHCCKIENFTRWSIFERIKWWVTNTRR